MTEVLDQPSKTSEDSQRKRGFTQYQYQTMALHNTLGLVFMSILAFALLVGLQREHARYRELAKQLAHRA
jgi:hypothetical protein